MNDVDFAFLIRNTEKKITEQRIIRKYLMRKETQVFVSELSRISNGHVRISDTGSIWLVLPEQPGFTIEANPELFNALEFISDYTEQFFKNIELQSLDLPESLRRQYIFTFCWHTVEFRIVVNCYLGLDSDACIRAQTGTRTEKRYRQVEEEVEVPTYQFIC